MKFTGPINTSSSLYILTKLLFPPHVNRRAFCQSTVKCRNKITNLCAAAASCSFDGENAIDGSQCGWEENTVTAVDYFNWVINKVEDGVTG